MSPPKARSTAQRLDAAWKQLVALQKKYGFPKLEEYHAETLRAEPFHMKSEDIDQVLWAVDNLKKWLGRVPWTG